MKNKIKGLIAAIAITFFVSAANAQNDNVSEKTGTILEIDNSGHGLLLDQESGDILEFERAGANVTFIVGDAVSYLRVTTPKGKVIVKDIKRP